MSNIEEIRFQQRLLRINRSEDGTIGRVCLNDICTQLKRMIYLKDGTALRRCPSAAILDPQRPELHFANFDEAIRFIQWMCSSSRVLSPVGRALMEELQAARMRSGAPTAGQDVTVPNPDTEQNVQVLHYSGYTFTMKMLDGRFMVNATEMARAFERRPREWLNLAETQRLRQELVDNGQFGSLEDQIITSRGPNGATWIEVNLWVNFAQWLSPAFAAWVSKHTTTLMREGSVSLDDHQSNVVDPSDEYSRIAEFPSARNLPAPTNFQEALTVIDIQKDALERQRDFFRANRHKFEYYDDKITNQEWFNTTMIALDLGTTAIQLNQFLCDHGLQVKIDGEWRIERQYRHLRCTHSYDWFNYKTRYLNRYKREDWSPEGREYIVQLWKRENG